MEPSTNYRISLLTKLCELANRANLDTELISSTLLLFRANGSLPPVLNALRTYREQLTRSEQTNRVRTVNDVTGFVLHTLNNGDETLLPEAFALVNECSEIIGQRLDLSEPW